MRPTFGARYESLGDLGLAGAAQLAQLRERDLQLHGALDFVDVLAGVGGKRALGADFVGGAGCHRFSFRFWVAQVLVVEVVGDRDVALVPSRPVSALVAAEQHDRSPLGIEREKCSQVSAERAQFLHVVMARALYPVGRRSAQRRALLFQEFDRREHRYVVVVIEVEDPPLRDGG